MQFVTKKTTDLSKEEKTGLVNLFNEVFVKERTVEEFDRQFLNNPEGFSYHTFSVIEDKIVASNSMVPSVYNYDGKQLRFVNSVDTMIAEHHRGLENFYDMIRASFGDAEKQGYDVVYGFPNDNSYELFTKLKFMKDVGKLDTYCLPYRIGGIKRSLKILNPLTILFCRFWTWCNSLFASGKIASFLIEKEPDSYNATRYKRGDGKYCMIDGLFSYKVMEFDGIRTAFIIDVFEKSAKHFADSVRYLIKHERNNFDLVLYIGHLSFGSYGLIKFPRKYEPKHFNFTASVLKSGSIEKKELLNIDNWDINLSNYDVI
ncbi:MAG: GNAT family N-acetyltransferase [Bacteroidaceae bacterium]|nr:GNAT family N-acetyltransferase [Bacteroidaceae bacterium]